MMFRNRKMILRSLALALMCILNVKAQASPPQIEVTGNQGYCADMPMKIVTSVSIGDPAAADTTLEDVFIQISEGYAVNQDLLSLQGTYPNITSTWSAVQGKLALNGPASYQEFTNAISNVVFETTQETFTEDKLFSINLSTANFLPSTGHYYVYEANHGITWVEAKSAAENQNLLGAQGYLATLTSVEESQLAGEQSQGTGWIGASDAEVENTWRWVTGPEAGDIFWIGQIDGTPQNGEYSFWNTGEPNNYDGDEDYAHITDSSIGVAGSWNDLPNAGNPDPSPYYPKGYIVEFGGMPGDPEINLSASTSIIMPRLTANTSPVCENIETQLTVTSNTSRILWYATETSSAVINEGFTYDVNIDFTTTYWLIPLFDGCTSGKRIPFTVTVFPQPDAVDISLTRCDDEVQDGLAVFKLNDYADAVSNGIVKNRTVIFYEDAGLTISIDAESYTSLSNPQTIYAEVINTINGCSNTSQIILQTNSSDANTAFLEQCDNPQETGLVSFDLSLAKDQVLKNLPQDFNVSYYLSYQDALFEENSLPVNYTNEVAYAQTIFARVEDNGDCYTIGEVQLNVIGLLPLETNEEVFYCLNNFPETTTISSGIINDNPNNYLYNWSTGETTSDIEINEPGVYTVEVIPVDGCPKTRTITVLPADIATIGSVSVNDMTDSNSITITVSGDGSYEYVLNDINGSWQNSNIFTNVPAGIYTVFVRDVENDCGLVSIEVNVIGYSSFFTPNGDGINDFWSLRGVSKLFLPNSKVFIFNRYGKLLYALNSAEESWDGTIGGKAMPTSDYWFSATLENGRNFKGHFTLKR